MIGRLLTEPRGTTQSRRNIRFSMKRHGFFGFPPSAPDGLVISRSLLLNSTLRLRIFTCIKPTQQLLFSELSGPKICRKSDCALLGGGLGAKPQRGTGYRRSRGRKPPNTIILDKLKNRWRIYGLAEKPLKVIIRLAAEKRRLEEALGASHWPFKSIKCWTRLMVSS